MKIEISIPDRCYKEIKEAKFPAQNTYRLIQWIKDGRIIEHETDNFVEIRTLRAGTTIEVSNIQMEILDTTYTGKEDEVGVLCLTKPFLFKDAFNKENYNNWKKSSLRKYLNGEYKKILDEDFVNALIPFNRDLLTDDGMKDYGFCVDLISLISCDEYRDYREYISNKSDWWWTLTAWSAKLTYSSDVRVVGTDNSFYNRYAYDGNCGVSPVFLLKPNFKVKIVDDEAKSEE